MYAYFHPRDREFAQPYVDSPKYAAIERTDVPPGRLYVTSHPIEESVVAQTAVSLMREQDGQIGSSA